MVPVLLLEKMRRPDPGGLSRKRLEQRLNGPEAPPVNLVLGPAGSGKTTLLSRVSVAATVPSAWYRAGAEDDTEPALVAHLAHGLASALGDDALPARAADGTVTGLVTAVQQGPDRSVHLVIDDLHELAGSPAERALERFLTLRPRRVRVLLGSRRPPQINSSRLLVSGELSQLDAEDLRFRSWEVEELFRSVYHRPLSPETAAALTRRTGGWAAGLQLFHLATSGMTRLERERAVEELSGRSRLIRSYLARNVLDGLAPARRAFLLRTCTLGVLTGATCDELLETTGSAGVLAELEQQQFFTTSSDDGASYRYHQVLQNHLEVLLVDELGAATARRLYARSATLLERAGLTAPALRAHARAEDWGSVARLLQQTPSALPSDEPVSLVGLPGLAPDDPGLVVANARRMVRAGRLADAVRGFRTAEALLDDPEFQARCVQERLQVAEWLPDAPVPDPHQAAPAERDLLLSRELRRATRTVREPRRPTTALARGITALLAGDARAAAEELGRARADSGAAAWEALVLRLAAQLSDLDPDHETDAARLEQIVLGADVEGLPWLSRVARGIEAALLYASQPTPDRLASGAELVAECDRQGDQWAGCLLAFALGSACMVSDAEEQGSTLLGRAAAAADTLGAPVLAVWARAFRVHAAAQRGEPAAALEQQEIRAVARRLGVNLDAWLPDHPSRPRATPTPRIVAPHVQLSCLGRFELAVEGRPVAWQGLRPRARSLLMFLALHAGRGIHRETLIEALWPDASLASGIRSLQVAVSSLRQCLGSAGLPDDCVQRHGDAYALCLPEASADLRAFEDLVRTAARAEATGDLRAALQKRLAALDCYAGDLLPEVGPAEWVVQERDRLRETAARVGAEAARLALRLDEPPTGMRAARRSIELDPYHDQSWELLVRLLEQAGDHTAAAVTRRDHDQVCADLGL